MRDGDGARGPRGPGFFRRFFFFNPLGPLPRVPPSLMYPGPPRIIDVKAAEAASRVERHRVLTDMGSCHCGARSTPASRLKVCSGCDATVYCSPACQRSDWPSHKELCTSLREAALASAPAARILFTNENILRSPLLPPTPSFAPSRCDGCGALEGGEGGGEGGAPLRLSSCACHTVVYCSPACQRKSWPGHRAACKEARAKAYVLDWTFNDSGGDLLGVARTLLARVDNAHELLQGMSQVLRLDVVPPAGAGFLGPDMKRDVMDHAHSPLQHALYLMSLDAIAFSLVFETLGGKARVYMCFMGAYSVGQWVAPRAPPALGPTSAWLARAHARWGGGRLLNTEELGHFCDALAELQAASQAAAEDLAECAPAVVRRAQKLFEARREPFGEPPLSRWVLDVMRSNPFYPGSITIYFDALPVAGGPFTPAMPPLHMSTNARHVGEPFTLRLSPATSARFANAHTALTGMLPTAETLMKLVVWRNWQCNSTQQAWRATCAILRKGALETGAAGGGRGAGARR